jgi:hypothetical protein
VNDAQEVFTVFYGLYFAASMALARPMQPFDTAGMYRASGYAWLRFLTSFAVLNLLPLGYFVLVFNWLQAVEPFRPNFSNLFMILVLSLAGFGFYRMYVGVMLCRFRERYVFYGGDLPAPFRSHLCERAISADSPAPHLVPGVVWVLLSAVAGRIWTHGCL